MRDWIDATAKEIGRWLNLDADVIEEISERIRRHVPPQPGEEPQAVQEPRCGECGAKLGHTHKRECRGYQEQDFVTDNWCGVSPAPQPSPSPVDIEAIRKRNEKALSAEDDYRYYGGPDPTGVQGYREMLFPLAKDFKTLLAELAASQAREKRLREEVRPWKPMTPEEAESALAAVKNAPPISEEEIERMVAFVTDPANRLDNDEQTWLTEALVCAKQREKRLREILKDSIIDQGTGSKRHWTDADINAALQQPSNGNPPTP